MKHSILLVLGVWVGSVFSQGFIVPGPGFAPPQLSEHRLSAVLQDQVAEIKVSQLYYNPSSRPIEGIYYFPIPQGAMINQFALFVDGKKLVGELLDKEQARAIYEDIVRRNIDPALLEYADHRFFRLSLFPIPPAKERKIELTYSQILPSQEGMVRLLYPLHGELHAGRGAGPVTAPLPHPVPSPARLERPERMRSTKCREVFSVTIKSSTAIGSVYSPSHKVAVQRVSDQEVHLSYEGDRSDDQGDFVLCYALTGDAMAMNLLCHRTEDKPGYFMVLITPKSSWSEGRIMDKDVVFVLDTSGSMEGDKISQAKAALQYCLNALRPQDRFGLVTFSSEVHTWRSAWSLVGDGRREALNHIRTLEARGGTNIDAALETAATFKPESGRLCSVVFITDGLPTVGAQDINTILSHTATRLTSSRIFTFGVGYDVNTFLLDKVAESSRAVADYIAPEENLEEKISRFFDKVSKPVLTDLEVTLSSGKIKDQYPPRLPDLFHNDQLLLVGRYEDAGATELILKGTSENQVHRFSYRGRFAAQAENEFLPRLWASRKIAYLVDDMRIHGENVEVRKEVEALSKEYGVLSPFTAYIAQEDLDQTHTLSFSRPQAMGKMAAEVDHGLMSLSMPSVGGVAVSMSKQLRQMKENEVVSSNPAMKVVGVKVFELKDGEWVETRYKGESAMTVKRNSDAHLNLLKCSPELGRYLALGEKVVVSWKGKYLRIADSGERTWSVERWQRFFK